jgi:hypothetical protein
MASGRNGSVTSYSATAAVAVVRVVNLPRAHNGCAER